MSGALHGIAGFANGFAGTRARQEDRPQREQDAIRQDALIAALSSTRGNAGGMGAYREADPAGGRSSSAGGNGAPGPATAGGQGLFGLIDEHEGGGNFDTLFGHSQNGGRFDGVRVSEMTLQELSDFASPSGDYGQWVKGQVGRVATPMGRHQIVGTTLRSTAAAMGLSPDSKFTPELQDRMANYLARQRLQGAGSQEAKRAALRAEWEGFKNVSNQALDAAIAHFEVNGGGIPSRPRGVSPT